MRLRDLTNPKFAFKDIYPQYVKPRLETEAEPSLTKPTKQELEYEQAHRRKTAFMKTIGMLGAVLFLFLTSFSIGGVLISAAAFAFSLNPRWFVTTNSAYLTWLITHFTGTGVFALGLIAAYVGTITTKDVLLFLLVFTLVGAVVASGLTSAILAVAQSRKPEPEQAETDEPNITPADIVWKRLPAILLDYYAPLSQFPRASLYRSQFNDEGGYNRAVENADRERHENRIAAVQDYIVSVEDEQSEDEGVVLITLRVKDTRQNLVKQAEMINDLLDAYGTAVEERRGDSGGSVTFRINTKPLPTAMEKMEDTKTQADFFLTNPTERILSYTAGVGVDGSVIALPLSHTLVLGATGAGKGSVFRAVATHAAPYIAEGTLRAYVIDPKNGEAKAFRKAAALFSAIEYKSERMADVVDEVYQILKTRQEMEDEWDISSANPVILLFVDELLSLFKDAVFIKRKDAELGGMTTLDKLTQILAQGRSDRVFVVAATQNATKQEMGNLRDNFTVRVLLRVDDVHSAAEYFLKAKNPEGVEGIAESTEDDGFRTAGIGYVKLEGRGKLTLMRFGFMPNSTFSQLAGNYQHVQVRPQAPIATQRQQEPQIDEDELFQALNNLS